MLRLTRMSRPDLPVLKNEDFAAPVDGVISKAGEPDAEGHQISNWYQP
jgi:hypothetical protein